VPTPKAKKIIMKTVIRPYKNVSVAFLSRTGHLRRINKLLSLSSNDDNKMIVGLITLRTPNRCG